MEIIRKIAISSCNRCANKVIESGLELCRVWAVPSTRYRMSNGTCHSNYKSVVIANGKTRIGQQKQKKSK